jgi:hypothetical protein
MGTLMKLVNQFRTILTTLALVGSTAHAAVIYNWVPMTYQSGPLNASITFTQAAFEQAAYGTGKINFSIDVTTVADFDSKKRTYLDLTRSSPGTVDLLYPVIDFNFINPARFVTSPLNPSDNGRWIAPVGSNQQTQFSIDFVFNGIDVVSGALFWTTSTGYQNDIRISALGGYENYSERCSSKCSTGTGYWQIDPASKAALVPLPATLPLFVGGLGLIGLARRRYRQPAKL